MFANTKISVHRITKMAATRKRLKMKLEKKRWTPKEWGKQWGKYAFFLNNRATTFFLDCFDPGWREGGSIYLDTSILVREKFRYLKKLIIITLMIVANVTSIDCNVKFIFSFVQIYYRCFVFYHHCCFKFTKSFNSHVT